MEDVYYRVYTDNGCHIWQHREEALRYYSSSNGNRIETVSKDLFPEIHIIINEPNFNTERIREDNTLKETSEALRKAIDKYDKKNTKQIAIKLNKNTDQDILDHLDRVKNKQGYIKELIRKDLEKNS